MTKVLSPKAPRERVPLAFDFTYLLGGQLTLDSVDIVSVAVVAGTDATPSGLLYGQAFVQDDRVIVQYVSGGVAGCDYRITATGNTSGTPARKLSLAALLPVRDA